MWENEVKFDFPDVEGSEDFQIPPGQLPANLATRLTASWQRNFDIAGLEKECVWGIFETLRLEEVFKVTEFVGRSRLW